MLTGGVVLAGTFVVTRRIDTCWGVDTGGVDTAGVAHRGVDTEPVLTGGVDTEPACSPEALMTAGVLTGGVVTAGAFTSTRGAGICGALTGVAGAFTRRIDIC